MWNIILGYKAWKKACCISDKACHNAEERIEEEPSPGGHPVRAPVNLSFKGIDLSTGGVKILQNVHGTAEPGQLLIVMGPSGSGKTTLFECLYGGRMVDRGVITLNGEVLNKDLRRDIGYVRQDDIFRQHMTVREILEFHASLRLRNKTSEQKRNHMDLILENFNMNNTRLLNTRITEKCGLSGGEKKRISIMSELMANNPVLLLDEPTTGLDSFNAYHMIRSLRNMAINDRKTIILTIHQPSSQIIALFDQLLLLSAGEVAYFGKAADVLGEMRELGFEIEPLYNTGDFLLELVNDKEKRDIMVERARRKREEESIGNETIPINNGNALNMEVSADQGTRLLRTRESDSGRSSMFSSTGNSQEDLDYDRWAVSWWMQFKILTRREFVCNSRAAFTMLKIFHTITLTIVFCVKWFRVTRIEENIRTIDEYHFFSPFINFLTVTFESLAAFSAERAVIARERQSGSYSLSAYILAKFVSTAAIVVIPTFVFYFFTSLCYGPQYNIIVNSQLMGMMLLTVITAVSIGLFISSCGLDHLKENVMCSLVCIPSMVFSSRLAQNGPSYISSMQYASPMYYSYTAMRNVEYQYGYPVMCAAKNSIYDECRNGNSAFIPSSDILGDSPMSTTFCNCILLFLMIIFILGTYLNLRFIKSPTRPRK